MYIGGIGITLGVILSLLINRPEADTFTEKVSWWSGFFMGCGSAAIAILLIYLGGK